MLILSQKSCFLGPTIFEIPHPNWYFDLYHPYFLFVLSFFFQNDQYFMAVKKIQNKQKSEITSLFYEIIPLNQ